MSIEPNMPMPCWLFMVGFAYLCGIFVGIIISTSKKGHETTNPNRNMGQTCSEGKKQAVCLKS